MRQSSVARQLSVRTAETSLIWKGGAHVTKREFVRELEDQLEMPEGSLKENQALAELAGWDSLAAVLFMALADEKLGVTLSNDQIAKSKTLNELLALLDDRLTTA